MEINPIGPQLAKGIVVSYIVHETIILYNVRHYSNASFIISPFYHYELREVNNG